MLGLILIIAKYFWGFAKQVTYSKSVKRVKKYCPSAISACALPLFSFNFDVQFRKGEFLAVTFICLIFYVKGVKLVNPAPR
jgi:hypothetical protein